MRKCFDFMVFSGGQMHAQHGLRKNKEGETMTSWFLFCQSKGNMRPILGAL